MEYLSNMNKWNTSTTFMNFEDVIAYVQSYLSASATRRLKCCTSVFYEYHTRVEAMAIYSKKLYLPKFRMSFNVFLLKEKYF